MEKRGSRGERDVLYKRGRGKTEEGTRLSQIQKLQPGRQSHDKRHRKSMRFTACKDMLVLPYLQQMMCLVAPPVHYGKSTSY
jgi:hypothetical protein